MAKQHMPLNRTVVRNNPNRLGRKLKRRLGQGPPLLGGIVSEYLRPSVVKVYCECGFDFIYLENEHAMMFGPQLTDFIQCARDNELPPIAKIGELGRAETARLLEAGVVGIQLPRTESRKQLLELIDYMKFPPVGTRAAAPCFGNVDYATLTDDRRWLRDANDATLLVAHIETALGYENAEQIITTPGLDMLYVGPYDFSVSMGRPGDYDHKDVKGPMQKILALCRKHHVPFGTTPSGPMAGKRWIKAGCRFFELIDEISLMRCAARDAVKAYR